MRAIDFMVFAGGAALSGIWEPRLGYNAPVMASIGYEDLVCPECKQPLVVTPDEDALKCGNCRRAYPIRDGIPVLLVDEAVIEPPSS